MASRSPHEARPRIVNRVVACVILIGVLVLFVGRINLLINCCTRACISLLCKETESYSSVRLLSFPSRVPIDPSRPFGVNESYCGGVGRGLGVGRGRGVARGVAVGVGVIVGVGVGPDPVLLRIVPMSPTTVPSLASVTDTSYKILKVPLSSVTQLFPPSVVLTIVPPSPTAIPFATSEKEASHK